MKDEEAKKTGQESDIKKALFVAKKMFAQLVYDFQSLEGMPFSYPEVKTFIQGITVGGHKIADHDKLKQQQLAWKQLIELVEQNKFELSEKVSCELEGIVAKDEALEPGIIRNGTVSVSSGDDSFHPPEHQKLTKLFADAIKAASNDKSSICDRGYKLALDYTYNQFHWDGNKRTGNLMMNGLFLSNGILPCSVPSKRLKEYNTLLVEFYKHGKYKPVMDFYKDCHRGLYKDWKMIYPIQKRQLSAVETLRLKKENKARNKGLSR
jgi:Fic family protein